MGSFGDYLESLKATEEYTRAKAQDCMINAILEQMRLQNLTEEKLAKKAHMLKSSVSRILSDEIPLFYWDLICIAHTLNCDIKTELVPKPIPKNYTLPDDINADGTVKSKPLPNEQNADGTLKNAVFRALTEPDL